MTQELPHPGTNVRGAENESQGIGQSWGPVIHKEGLDSCTHRRGLGEHRQRRARPAANPGSPVETRKPDSRYEMGIKRPWTGQGGRGCGKKRGEELLSLMSSQLPLSARS